MNRDVGHEIEVMLKRSLNTKLPVIVDAPPTLMKPKHIDFNQEELELYNFELVESLDKNIMPIARAKENIRLNKAVNAFMQAGIPANTYTHIGYYQIPNINEKFSSDKDETTYNAVKKYRYFLLW